MAASISPRTIEISHVVIETLKPFDEVRASLEVLILPIDPEIPVLLENGITDRLKQRLDAAPELSVFLTREHGRLLGIYGQARCAVQYEIGNALTASTMMRRTLAAGLYAPVRIVLYELDDGRSRFEYDLPSSLFGQFGDEIITELARKLDIALVRALSSAAGLDRYSSSNS